MADPHPTPADEPREITQAPVTAFVLGLVAGLGSALLGIGGGLLMVPGMVWLMRLRQHRAVGTSLAVILPTAVIAAYQYHQEAVRLGRPGLTLWVVFFLALGGVFGGTIGATVANLLGAKQLRRLFGLFVMATGIVMITRVTAPPTDPSLFSPLLALQLTGVGVLVGAVAGLLGVGGGLVMVPALGLLLGYGQHQAQAVSLAVIIPVSFSAVVVHTLRGNVVWSLFPWMTWGAVLGAYLMAIRVYEIPRETLRGIFGVFLLLVGLSMALSRPERKPARQEPGEPESRPEQ